MSFGGFDPDFADLPDYIVKITERIWEGRGIDLIRRYYAEDCPVHASMGPSVGLAPVISGTIDTLAAFPDRRLLPEDIIWSGDEDAGFLSSHRIISPMHHRGPGLFGPPTGRLVYVRTIADCFCVRNRVAEEWLARDQAGLALQLGVDPFDLARRLAEADALAGKTAWHLEAARALRADGRLRPPVHQDHPAARFVRQAFEEIWNGAALSRIREAYHAACALHLPGARDVYGHDAAEAFVLGYKSAFPDARLAVEHSIARDDPGYPTRVATRWWLAGSHAGQGAFGAPSGAIVLILGITHHTVIDGRIREEWTLVDELAVLKQIAVQRG
jgi:predicted ester cyclase